MEKSEIKGFIAKRVAKELKDGDVVNLGIGPAHPGPRLPARGRTCDSFSPRTASSAPAPNPPAPTLNPPTRPMPAASPAQAAKGGCYIDSATSFAFIRGGHVNATILGGLEVDQEGSLSNWIIPGKKVPGMGGAMDLLVGAKNVIVAMEHTAKGNPKILKKCKLPYTAVKCITKIITEMGVMEVTDKGLVLTEYNPEFTVEEIQAATEATLIISPELKSMV